MKYISEKRKKKDKNWTAGSIGILFFLEGVG